MRLELLRRFNQVRLVYDIVAVKDASRFVASQAHGNTLPDACPYKIPHGGPPEVVDNQPA
jgi:hypothetical protein